MSGDKSQSSMEIKGEPLLTGKAEPWDCSVWGREGLELQERWRETT